MRLSVIFLAVLAVSVLVASLAAWGITYGTSYNRVTTMSQEFTVLSHETLSAFGSFVAALIQSNANLVNTILTQEKASGEDRMQQTKANMITAIGTLVNYTTNATVQSQAQMNGMVDTFAGLMGAVVANFRGLTNAYSTQLRAALAEKVSSIIGAMSTTRITAMQRYPVMQGLGQLNFSRAWSDPIGLDDCVTLASLCATQQELGPADQAILALATGRYYNCSSLGASISTIAVNGSAYNEDVLKWLPYNSSVPASTQKPMLQRCLTEAPVVQRVGQDCPLVPSPGCQCGNDQRCSASYALHAPDTVSRLRPGQLITNSACVLCMSLSYSVLDPKSGILLGVLTDIIPGTFGDPAINAIPTSPGTTIGLVLLDGVTFPLLSIKGQKCTANDTIPGNTSLPIYSALRSCDPAFRWMAQWISQNLAAAMKGTTVENNGTVWDTSLSPSGTSLYVVGTSLAEINGPIDASIAQATGQLNAVRAQSLSQVAASGDATRAYMAAVATQNVLRTQAMEATFRTEIDVLDGASREALATSQQSTSERVQQLTLQQATQIDALKTKHLDAMSTATGWTLGVVFAILLAVMMCSAWGTIRLTDALLDMIGLMEDVAKMRVEDQELPQGSAVREVARIQAAFRVLVLRLAEYKSYIPAGLFEQPEEELTRPGEGRDGRGESEQDSGSEAPQRQARASAQRTNASVDRGTCGSENRRLPSVMEVMEVGSLVARKLSRIFVAVPSQRGAKRTVAVLAVNAMDFLDLLRASAESSARSLFNDYVTCVHEAASQARGNVDCVLGDQLFVTFGAHIPCSDGPGAATAAALEMRHRLLQKLGDRMKFQIGVSSGVVFASSVGYTKYKSMVAVGSPMKVAALLSHLPRFGSGTILVDAAIEERVKFVYKISPVELLHMGDVKSLNLTTQKSQPAFAVLGKKVMEEVEWMYQIGENDGNGLADWAETFKKLVVAGSPTELQGILQRYLVDHPSDETALRLQDRLPLWVPGVGITL
eukprot:EG_transcript_1105